MFVKINDWLEYSRSYSKSLKYLFRDNLSALNISPVADIFDNIISPPFKSLVLTRGSNEEFFLKKFTDDDLSNIVNYFDKTIFHFDFVIPLHEVLYFIDKKSIAFVNGKLISELLESNFSKKLINLDDEVNLDLEANLNIFDSHLESHVFHEAVKLIYTKIVGNNQQPEFYNVDSSDYNMELITTKLPLKYFRIFECGNLEFLLKEGDGSTGSFYSWRSQNPLSTLKIFVLGTSSAYSALVPILTHYFERVNFFWGSSFDEILNNSQVMDYYINSDIKIFMCRDRFVNLHRRKNVNLQGNLT